MCLIFFFQLHPENSLAGLSASIVEASYAASFLFVACEVGYQVSHLFIELSDVAFQWNWYQLPKEIKRMLPIIFIVIQKPVPIECFRTISCDRENFKMVSQASMLLRMNHMYFFY